MKRLIGALLLAFAIAGLGCATTPQTPAQSVYQAQGSYAAALQIAVTYKQLPNCTQPAHPVLCSDAATVAKLQKADDVAYAALTAAQNIVRSPGAGANVQTAITTAQQAVSALASITATLKVQP